MVALCTPSSDPTSAGDGDGATDAAADGDGATDGAADGARDGAADAAFDGAADGAGVAEPEQAATMTTIAATAASHRTGAVLDLAMGPTSMDPNPRCAPCTTTSPRVGTNARSTVLGRPRPR
jgi:hypothetical protein